MEQAGIDKRCAVLGGFRVRMRQLPHDFQPYSTVHSFYRRARISESWNKILEHLVKRTRKMIDARKLQVMRSLILKA